MCKGVVKAVARTMCGGTDKQLEDAIAEGDVIIGQSSSGNALYYFPSENSAHTESYGTREHLKAVTDSTETDFVKIRDFMKGIEWNPIKLKASINALVSLIL